MPSTPRFEVVTSFRANQIRYARALFRLWASILRDEFAYARRYASTQFWPSAWAVLHQALTVTVPALASSWIAYRAAIGGAA